MRAPPWQELTKPVGEISRARLQSKLEIALRHSALADPYRDSLTCGLLPYNLTNQLLRIINASRTAGAAPPPPPQSASRTPGLDAFTFEYAVEWPLSLVLSKHAITKYQLVRPRRPTFPTPPPRHRRPRSRCPHCPGASAPAQMRVRSVHSAHRRHH